jgi:hypothetical protein
MKILKPSFHQAKPSDTEHTDRKSADGCRTHCQRTNSERTNRHRT